MTNDSVCDAIDTEMDNNFQKETLLQSENSLKGKTVEQHPLARTSSNSSSSSTEYESGSLISSINSQKTRRSKVAPVGRIKDFLTRSDDNAKVDVIEGNTYSNLWHNKTKILNNLKKQATESVRSLTQSASYDGGFSQGFMYKSHNNPADSSASGKKSIAPSSSQSGLIKASTDIITENQQDTEVNSFLKSFEDKSSDPLSVIKQKEDFEKDYGNEEDPLENARIRSFTSSAVMSSIPKDTKKWPDSSIRSRKTGTIVSGAKKSTLAVSLSSLMASNDENPADDDELTLIVETKEKTEEKLVENVSPPTSDDSSSQRHDQAKPPETPPRTDPPSLFLIFFLSLMLYLYLVLPVPVSIRIAFSCFVFGCFFTSAVLCLVTPKSSRPGPFLPPIANSGKPHPVPHSIYDPDRPIKGWMNELYTYDPDTYHISNTHSVYITLDGATLRLQTPQKSIARRSIYNEGSIPITNVIHQRIFDITWAKVYLRPPGLVKKRVWSKKYPVCVEIPGNKSLDSDRDLKAATSERDSQPNKPHPDTKLLYLFGRTDRQKEQWFYRIQRSINVARARHNKNLKTSKVKLSESGLQSFGSEDEWGIIDDHYEEEVYVSSNACDITKVNEQPIRTLQDYFVHVSRLFPQPDSPTSPLESSKGSKKSSQSSLTDQHQVAWLNVVLGRVVFDFLRQQFWTKWLFTKVQKKLDKIKLPYFINGLKLTEMDLGSSVPLVHEISLPKLDAQGVWFDVEITYNGSAQMTLETKLILTKLGKNETAMLERSNYNRTEAVTDSDAEDSAESSDEEESVVSRFVGQVQSAVSKIDGQQLFKDAIKAVGKDPPEASSYGSSPPSANSLQSPTSGAPPKKWMRIMDSITKSKYFQKAADSEFVRKKLETVSNTPMLLTVELLQLKGTLVINVAPPPTDRVWYGFRDPPLMQLKAHPKVGERVVKTTHVTDWIENKLQQEVTKFLVMPNMDDIPIPIMFHNRDQGS